jgi:formate dehydrogenase major subunit
MTLLKEPDHGTPASSSEQMVSVEVDGVAVTVPAGTSVMRAATSSAPTEHAAESPGT